MPTAAAVCHFLGCLSNWRLVQNDPHYLSICMYIYIYFHKGKVGRTSVTLSDHSLLSDQCP